MVVKIEGKPAQTQPDRVWRIWTGPLTLAAVFILVNLYLLSSPLPLSPLAVAALEVLGLLIVALPFVRLVRDVNVGRYGVEATLYLGPSRYLRWDEISSADVHSHVFIPSRVRLEDVYGRRIYLKGELSSINPVLQGLRRMGINA